jgi:hypothetical protein
MSDPSLRGIRNRPRDQNRREAEVSDQNRATVYRATLALCPVLCQSGWR